MQSNNSKNGNEVKAITNENNDELKIKSNRQESKNKSKKLSKSVMTRAMKDLKFTFSKNIGILQKHLQESMNNKQEGGSLKEVDSLQKAPLKETQIIVKKDSENLTKQQKPLNCIPEDTCSNESTFKKEDDLNSSLILKKEQLYKLNDNAEKDFEDLCNKSISVFEDGDDEKNLTNNLFGDISFQEATKELNLQKDEFVNKQKQIINEYANEPSECEKSLFGDSLNYNDEDFKNKSLFNISVKNDDEESILMQFAELAIKSASRATRESLTKNERPSLNTSETQYLTKMPQKYDSPRNSNIFQQSLNRSGFDGSFNLDMSYTTESNEMQKIFDDVSFNSSFDKSKTASVKKTVDVPLLNEIDVENINKDLADTLYTLDDETTSIVLEIFTTMLWEPFEAKDEEKVKNILLKIEDRDDEEFVIYADITRWFTMEFLRRRYTFNNYTQYFNKIIEEIKRLQDSEKYRSKGLQPGDMFADGTILDVLAVDQVISEYSDNLIKVANAKDNSLNL
uniref:Protein-serine/threonine phosphatase n=1 Tax=Parastrongyloides trichosuri TaxID=131310 RepID=A0A0N4ZG90_PARTI